MNKNKMIVISVTIAVLVFDVIIVFSNRSEQRNISDNKASSKETTEPIEDVVTLDIDTILTRRFPLNYPIDYKHYINGAYSTVDGDLSDKVTYNEIDTSQLGDYTVTFSVTDSLGNKESKELTFTIFEQVYFGDDPPLPSDE